ncbi:MAG TPA: hypothetical protein VN690_07040 [Terriglobales bacterium]|nr:hypothetical protein [Terriglobales bacterium]
MTELPQHGDRRSHTQASAGPNDFRRRSSEVEVVRSEAAVIDAEDQRRLRQEAIAAYEFIDRLD